MTTTPPAQTIAPVSDENLAEAVAEAKRMMGAALFKLTGKGTPPVEVSKVKPPSLAWSEDAEPVLDEEPSLELPPAATPKTKRKPVAKKPAKKSKPTAKKAAPKKAAAKKSKRSKK